MTDSGPRKIGVSIELKPHAYNPTTAPELFEGVLARRLIAFVIDLIIIVIPIVLLGIMVAAATIATLGLALVFFAFLSPLYWPLIVIWVVCYYGFSFGSPASATIGMRVMELEMRTWYGSARLFRARCRACDRVLDHGLVSDAADPAGRIFQRPQTTAARHGGGHGCDQ